MERMTKLIGLLALMTISGCATPGPMTFEESLTTHRATRSDVTDLEAEMRYRVGIQYANAARKNLDRPGVTAPRNTSMNFELPFAVLDYSLGDDVSGGMAIASWFNSGLSQNSRYQYYYTRGLNFMAHPNTHYFRFDVGSGVPSADEVREDWNDAKALFEKLFNRDGQCQVMGFSEKHQYTRTFSKDVAGEHKMTGWYCPHPVLSDREFKVYVSTWASPFDDVRLVSMIQMQCYILEKGERFIDVRGCGEALAAEHRDLMTKKDADWMQLAVEPAAEEEAVFHVVGRVGDQETTLPAPGLKKEFSEFLSKRGM